MTKSWIAGSNYIFFTVYSFFISKNHCAFGEIAVNFTVIGQTHEKLSLISLIFVTVVFAPSFNRCWLVQDMMDKLRSSWATDRCSLCGSCESMADNESHQSWQSQSCKWRTWKIRSNWNLIECIFSFQRLVLPLRCEVDFTNILYLYSFWACNIMIKVAILLYSRSCFMWSD